MTDDLILRRPSLLTLVTNLAFAAGISACSGEISNGVVPTSGTIHANAAVALDIGAQGSAVNEVHDFLKRSGYFPNPDLQRDFPAWRPIVNAEPARWDRYDNVTARAVREFQVNSGLAPTGKVDVGTRSRMDQHHCGVPDGIQSIDPKAKYKLWGFEKGSPITWNFGNSPNIPNLTVEQIEHALAGAFASWENDTDISFQRVPSSESAIITVQFWNFDWAPGLYGWCKEPQFTGIPHPKAELAIAAQLTNWSVDSPTPPGKNDLEALLVHEIGHCIGLGHSRIGGAVMESGRPLNHINRPLGQDDTVGLSALYDTWERMPGGGIDIGAAINGSLWIIGGDRRPYKFNGSNWDVSDNGNVSSGARIDVEVHGIPWMVTNTGQIMRRNSDSPFSGTWELMPGLAKDIGIGLAPGGSQVWVVGSDGRYVHKWNGSSWDPDRQLPVTGLSRISIDTVTGNPWVVDDRNRIWRKDSANVSSGTWRQLPGLARDVGVSMGNYAWTIGTAAHPVARLDYLVSVWNEQAEVDSDGGRFGWLTPTPAAAGTQIDVGPRHLGGVGQTVYVINSSGEIWRTRK